MEEDERESRNVTVITGANSGLGLETVKELAVRKTGQVIVMACRSLTKAKAALETVTDVHQNTELRGMELDLADLDSVRRFASDLRLNYTTIDCLICNAGVLVPSSSDGEIAHTKDGFEINVGTNHLGHVLLIHLLTDILNSGRVILVSSILLKNAEELDLELITRRPCDNNTNNPSVQRSNSNVIKEDPKKNYCQSKLMNALYARQLAKRFPSLQIFCVSPGWCKTQLHRNTDIPWYGYIGIVVVGLFFMKSAKQGCQTIVHCASAESSTLQSGKFYRNSKVDDGIEDFLNQRYPDGDLQDEFYQMSKNAVCS